VVLVVALGTLGVSLPLGVGVGCTPTRTGMATEVTAPELEE
jgi:hypothetical protein